MKRWMTLAMAFGLTQIPVDIGAEDNFGIGFLFGVPSDISAKVPLGGVNSLNFLLGYDTFRGGSHVYMHGDYVWHNYDVIPVAKGKLPLYYGPGVKASLSGNSSIGIRGVIGIEYQFADVPLSAIFEIGPGINVIPDPRPGISAGLGGRFYF
jgi:hypothetical protein